jgi:hypothetical protein
MGAAFGLSDELAAQVVRYLVPPIARTINKRTETSQGLLHFLEFLGNRRNERCWNDPGIFGHPQMHAEGHAVLTALFPQAAHIRKIIGNRAKVLPVQPETLEAMFPYVALLALAAIERRTREPLGSILQHLAKDRLDEAGMANPYKTLAGEIRRRRMTSKARTFRERSGLSGVFGALFSRADARSAA